MGLGGALDGVLVFVYRTQQALVFSYAWSCLFPRLSWYTHIVCRVFDDWLGDIQEHRPSSGPDNPLEYSGATPEVSEQKEDHDVVKHSERKASHGRNRCK